MKVFILTLTILWTSIEAFAQIEDFAAINFRQADSVASLYQGHELDNLLSLSQKLTSPFSTDVEKFRAIYTWVCRNIKSDYYLNQQNQNARKNITDPKELKKWNKDVTRTTFRKLLKNKSTVCTGYAYLLRELAYYAGIRCVIVDGYGRTVAANVGGTGTINHSWNAVRLNNKWYLCDATWSSGAIDLQLKEFVPRYNDAYFLLEPTVFIRNHYPADSAFFLTNTKPTLVEFLNRPLVYSYFFDYKFTQLSPETFEVGAFKNKPLHLEFERSKKTIETVEVQINDGIVSTVTPDQTDGVISFDHTFTAKGNYFLHVKLDGNYVVTYKVTVK